MKADLVGYFWEYAEMYCADCGCVSHLSLERQARHRAETAR